MAITLNGTTGITTPEITLDNTAADGGQVVLKSSGFSNWNIDNYSGTLRAYYNATENFKIDSSGRVTMPNQPCFFGAPNATVSATNKVTSYTNTRTRGGITFNSGVITVPVAGEYSVLINAITNGSAALTYSLRRNGSILSYSAIDSGSFRTCALLEVVQMAANDYLEVWVDNGTMHSDAQYNAVSVFLIG